MADATIDAKQSFCWIVLAHRHVAVDDLVALRMRLTDAGLITPLRREIAPALLRLTRSCRLAQRRYEQACAIYLAILPERVVRAARR